MKYLHFYSALNMKTWSNSIGKTKRMRNKHSKISIVHKKLCLLRGNIIHSIKGYLHNQTTSSQNVSSEAHVKDFVIT